MSKKAFQKFIDKPKGGAKLKEAIRQEKRKEKVKMFKRNEEAKFQKANSKSGFGNAKVETRNQKSEIQNPKPETPNKKYQISNPKPQTTSPKNPTANFKPQTPNPKQDAGLMPLNKFIAHSGVCARREAAELVKTGKVQVNNAIIYEPGFKVSDTDKVKVNGKQVFLQHNLVYILLNKPKDYITTSTDPQGRKTVTDLVKHATQERVYPVGRLDRNTTGVLLLTNDGELAQKLTHPSYEIKKIYEVKLDKQLIKNDFENILNGITLEDGLIAADSLAYADPKDKSIIGIEIHSGRNRIVRRIFEHLGYAVNALDRVMFANLTKKNVDRGKWRFLNEKEVRLLKYLNQGFVKKPKQE